ncbi:hypothetical protein KKC44_05415 [Patescibacteria group bacterium]|nr:hypothetical protein [Patescibacteria group bacterium]
MLILAGDLLLSGLSGAKLYGYELSNRAVRHLESIDPRLRRTNHVALRVLAIVNQARFDRLTGDRVDHSGSDCQGYGLLECFEADPQRFSTVHWDDMSRLVPVFGRFLEVCDPKNRKVSETGGQGMLPFVWYAKRTFQRDGQMTA